MARPPWLKALGIEHASGLDAGDIFNQATLALQNFDDGLNLLVVDNAIRARGQRQPPHGPHWHVLLTSRQVVGAFELMELGTAKHQFNGRRKISGLHGPLSQSF